MAKKGQKMSDAERRTKTLENQIHYGVSMAIRIDLGGLKDHKKYYADKVRGMTADEAGEVIAYEVSKQINAIRTRIKHPINEIKARAAILEVALVAGDDMAIRQAAELFLFGSDASPKGEFEILSSSTVPTLD